jgi:hypothetical protein
VSAHPAGAGLARLVARAQRRYQHAQAHRKRTQVLIGAVDTHGRTYHAAVIDQRGRLLGDQEFSADRGGSRLLLSRLSHQPLGALQGVTAGVS